MQEEQGRGLFQAAVAQLKAESEAALQRAAEKSQQVEELQREVTDRSDHRSIPYQSPERHRTAAQ